MTFALRGDRADYRRSGNFATGMTSVKIRGWQPATRISRVILNSDGFLRGIAYKVLLSSARNLGRPGFETLDDALPSSSSFRRIDSANHRVEAPAGAVPRRLRVRAAAVAVSIECSS
jgi:hypothetical protein